MSGSGLSSEPKEGDRVRLVSMEDPSGPMPGDEGTIAYIGEVSSAEAGGVPALTRLVGRRKYWVAWDNGGTMAMIEGLDRFVII